MPINLGTIQLDDTIVLKQLKRDLKDDWFPDSRFFDDVLGSGHFRTVIEKNFNENSGFYKPIARTLLNIPKSNFTLRYGLETGIADRAIYHGLAAQLVPVFDPLLAWNIFSHRASRDDRYLFQRAIQAWKSFIGVVRAEITEDHVLLSTDLSNYFENIQLNKLKGVLEDLLPEVQAEPARKGELRTRIAMLFDCLKVWSFTDTHGLPQNRDASSFLANMYMLPVDRVMLGFGYKYYRYMDDIKIVCRDVNDARRALKRLSLALREMGLSVNSGKTEIRSGSDSDAIAHCLDLTNGDLDQIDAIWSTRNARVIRRSFPLLQQATLDLLKRGDTSKRMFRYCISRLTVLAQCREFEVPDQYFHPITPLIIDALEAAPYAADQFTNYLRAVPLLPADYQRLSQILRDKEANIYTWQAYRIWMLLVQRQYAEPELLDHAAALNKAGADDANRAGAVLYLGALGDRAKRIEIAEKFGRAKSYLGQRSAILALQELPYRPHIENYVSAEVRPDLVGIYRIISNQGIYFSPLEPTSITKFIDIGPEYG